MPKKERKTEDSEQRNTNILPEPNTKKSPNTIEEWEELQIRTDLDALDTRKRPDYTVSYKQDVKTEDVFLQVIL